MSIYNRLPQSLKANYEEDTGQLYNPEVSEDGFRLSHTQTQVYFPNEGTFTFPDFEIDSVSLEIIPGDYILGFALIEGEVEEVTTPSLPTEDMLYGIFLNPLHGTINLTHDDEEKVYTPGYPLGFLRVRAEGLLSIKVQTDESFLVGSVEYFPSDGYVELTVVGDEVVLERVGTIKNLFITTKRTVKNKEPQLFLQPVGRETLSEIPDIRSNICLLNFSQSRRISVLRKFHRESPDLEITKLLTGFWDNELDKAYETLFYYIVDYLNPFTAKSEFMPFLAQQWGWQGKYYATVGGSEEQKRNLMSVSWGTNFLTRTSRPEIGSMRILFQGTGFTNWSDWQERFFVDFAQEEFMFPGALAHLSPTGFPWRLAPYIVQGSYVYFDEPPSLSPPIDLEYITGEGWRFKAENTGLIKISRLEGRSEIIEYEVVPWDPEERDAPGVWYGTWGSKGTLHTLETLIDTVDLHGVREEHSVRINPRVLTFPLEEGFDFNNILVDDQPVGSRRVKGIENRTSSSTRARLSFDPGTNLLPEFSKVDVEYTDGVSLFKLDVTEQILTGITFSVYPSKKNATKLLEPWFTPAPLSDYVRADENLGAESKHGFLRLPFDYPRDGKEWLSAESICDLFTVFGKENDTLQLRERRREPVPFYEENFRKASARRFFQEDYLISRFGDIDTPEEDGWAHPTILSSEDIVEEPGWKVAKITPYDALEERRILFNFWVGKWWMRVGTEPLSGFLSRDVKEGKLVRLPRTWKDYPASFLPRLSTTWEEKTNLFLPCYAYAAADVVAANEPVFDIEAEYVL